MGVKGLQLIVITLESIVNLTYLCQKSPSKDMTQGSQVSEQFGHDNLENDTKVSPTDIHT